MLDIVWSGEIVTRAHHGGSASSNSEAERFGRIPADRDPKEHGGEETVTGANRTFRLYGGGRQKKLSGGSGKDCAVMAHGHGDMRGLSRSNDFHCGIGDLVGCRELLSGELPQLADAGFYEKDAAFLQATLETGP